MPFLKTTQTAALICSLLAGASLAVAQGSDVGIVELASIERVPSVFNFQARVTQAKMGLEDAVVTVEVNLQSGDSVLCKETFDNVRIRNSLLNLSIGTECNLDVHLASYSDVDLRVCIQNANCLEPIKLGSVPFALKANMAVQAQYAPRADYAARSWIANRASADRQLAGRTDGPGVGYFDFYTHPDPTAQSIETNTTQYEPYVADGFIQWAPLSSDAPRMHICALDPDTDTPAELAELMVHAATTIMKGNAAIDGGVLTLGSDGSSSSEIVSAQDNLLLNAANTITSHKLTVGSGQVFLGPDSESSSQFTENLLASDKDLTIDAPNVKIPKGLSVTEGLSVTGDLTVENELRVTKDVHITGNLSVSGGTTLAGGFVASDLECEGCVSGTEIQNAEINPAHLDLLVRDFDLWQHQEGETCTRLDFAYAKFCALGNVVINGSYDTGNWKGCKVRRVSDFGDGFYDWELCSISANTNGVLCRMTCF